MPRILIATLITASLTGCGPDNAPITGREPQVYAFAAVFQNTAFGDQKTAIFVDVDGNQFFVSGTTVDLDLLPSGEDVEPFGVSKGQLDTFFANSAFVQFLIVEQVDNHLLTLRTTDGGPFTDPVGQCADSGQLLMLGFLYDQVSEVYQPVLLREDGDFGVQNQAFGADDIADWLEDLATDNGIFDPCP